MSLITRCPACTTLFKVVPDQLRVSEGWVRCGQCDEVFDANAHLQGDGHVPVAQPEVVPESTTWEASLPVEESGVDTEPQMPVDPAPELEQELAAKLEWPEAPSTNYDALMEDRPGAAFHPEPALHLEMPDQEPAPQAPEVDATGEGLAAEPVWDDAPLHVPPESPVVAEPVQMVVPPASTEIASAPAPLSAHTPTFMRIARKDSRWNKPWVRRSMAALAVFLMVGLALQITLHERDRLAASLPGLRPGLLAMCEALECQITPFKQIDSVVIDASSFVKLRGDDYRLNVTLKNTAPIDVAAPAVELTLTDTQDQPMIRHVLTAAQLGAQQGTLVAGGELTAAVPLHVKTAGSAERISGYRLLAFYP
jgi:predicted Zn finger-like uncharacterized protein